MPWARRPKAAVDAGGKAKQSSLLGGGFDFEVYPQLKKPMEVIGKAIDVPGGFWDKCPAADKEKLFKCTVRDFSIAHRFAVGIVCVDVRQRVHVYAARVYAHTPARYGSYVLIPPVTPLCPKEW